MLLLDSEAISAVAHGPAARRDRVRALVREMRARELPVATLDPHDLERLATHASNVSVADVK